MAITTTKSEDNDSNTKVQTTVQLEIEDCDYETAITLAGHGKYNWWLIVAIACPTISSLLSTSVVSFILPSAECDLDLSNFEKGLLNGVIYLGAVATGFIWGFLSDTMGRQKLLVYGYGLDGIVNIVAGLAQSYTLLLASKLLDGLICAGPYAIMMTYLAECNPPSHRSSVVQWSGLLTASGTVILPLLAWGVLPQDWDISIGWLELPSWRIFMLLSVIPSLIGSATFYFRWESPKFLLAQGKSTQALDILRRIYVINTGNSPDSYPVKSLKLEVSQQSTASSVDQKSSFRALLAGFEQVKPMLRHPYLKCTAIVLFFQFGALLGYNTIRLWMPQLFATIMEAERTGLADKAYTVCSLLDQPGVIIDNITDPFFPLECIVTVDNNVYINSIYIGLVTGTGFIVAGYLTRWIQDITLILISTVISVASCVAMYWGVSSNLMLIFSSLFVTCTSIASTAILSVTMLLFPTHTRTMAVALVMMFGQIGGILGNVLFPIFLEIHCSIPFFLFAAIILLTGLIVLLLPKEVKTNNC